MPILRKFASPPKISNEKRSVGPPGPPAAIGEAFGGGFFAGQISTAGNGIADYNLVVGPASSAQTSSTQWKTSETSTSGTSSAIDGPTNSSSMNNASHPAAQFCEAVSTGGFSDWYLPAKNELEVCYFNLKPTAPGNQTSSGINPNAVPPRASNYPSGGPPTQTSAANFQSTGTEDFNGSDDYWSSTEGNSTQAWRQFFSSGGQYQVSKIAANGVRAVRRVAV